MKSILHVITVTALALACALTSVSCGTSNSAVETALKGIDDVYAGLFKVLEEQKADPEKGIAAAEKFIDDNAKKMAEYGKIINQKLSAEQVLMVKKFNKDTYNKYIKESLKFKDSYGKNDAVAQRALKLMPKLEAYHSLPPDK
jgi:hypothetical protein